MAMQKKGDIELSTTEIIIIIGVLVMLFFAAGAIIQMTGVFKGL